MSRSGPFARSKTFAFSGGSLPLGLVATTHTVNGSEPLLDREFTSDNVSVGNGFLQLKVPGGQSGRSNVRCAEVTTDFKILYGSVRTWAVLSNTDGVCNGMLRPGGTHISRKTSTKLAGMFMYHSDNQETDIEWLGQPEKHSGSGLLHFVNQAIEPNKSLTQATVFCPDDATTAVHEYRLDWTPEATTFYVDGAWKATLRENVPTEAGPLMWNCWTNGNPHWSRGPPVTDAMLKIQKIVIECDDVYPL